MSQEQAKRLGREGEERRGSQQAARMEEVQRKDEEGVRHDEEQEQGQEEEQGEEGWIMTDEELAALLNRHRVRSVGEMGG